MIIDNNSPVRDMPTLFAGVNSLDVGKCKGTFHLAAFEHYGVGRKKITARPIFELEFENLLTNAGAQIVEDLLIGAGGTVFSNANAYIGSGDSSTAVNATHTDLQAATNKLRKAQDATFPSRASQTLTFKSTFATGDANWQWNEMAVFNASSAGIMLCRSLVSSPFTKTSALSIVATYTWVVS